MLLIHYQLKKSRIQKKLTHIFKANKNQRFLRSQKNHRIFLKLSTTSIICLTRTFSNKSCTKITTKKPRTKRIKKIENKKNKQNTNAFS
jgi:uncharacterized membrane protein affecting hemolysin expression